MRNLYAPSSLSEIDAVEIVRLEDIYVNHPGEEMREIDRKMSHIPRRFVEGETAQRIADLWRGLPPDAQMRCHNPPFGLRFFKGKSLLNGPILLVEGSICWECNNLYATVGKEQLF